MWKQKNFTFWTILKACVRPGY